MEMRPMGFAGAREGAFEGAGDLEQGYVFHRASCAIGFDGFPGCRFAPALGELVEPAGGEAAWDGALLPGIGRGRLILRRFTGQDLELIAVIEPPLSGEGFDAEKIPARFCERVDQIRVGEPADDP